MRCHGGFIITHGIGEMELADSRGMGWKGGTIVTGLSGVDKIPLRNSRRQRHVIKAIIFIHNCYRQHPTTGCLMRSYSKRHNVPVQAHRGAEAQLHPFLTSAQDEGGWSTSHPSHFTPGK